MSFTKEKGGEERNVQFFQTVCKPLLENNFSKHILKFLKISLTLGGLKLQTPLMFKKRRDEPQINNFVDNLDEAPKRPRSSSIQTMFLISESSDSNTLPDLVDPPYTNPIFTKQDPDLLKFDTIPTIPSLEVIEPETPTEQPTRCCIVL